MSQNNARSLSGFTPAAPSAEIRQPIFKDHVFGHVTNLFCFKLRATPLRYENLTLNLHFYHGMEQLVFERYNTIETLTPGEIDWDQIEKLTANYIDAVSSKFDKVGSAELKPIFLKQTQDYVENFLVYEHMYPRSLYNPWSPLLLVFKKGLMVNPTNDPYLLKQLEGKTRTKSKLQSPLQFLVHGAKDRPGKLAVGEQYHLQVLLLNMLQDNDASVEKPIPIKKMVTFLKRKGYDFKYDHVQIHLTTPLKKTGLVGSSSDGFFLIRTPEDLIASFCFHFHKDLSISHILSKYRRLAPRFGVEDLESEC